jgi:predicted PurR-regulated permease PerM
VLQRFVGARVERYLSAAGATTKAVVYGLILTALAQGTLAGLGYWMAGVHAPVLLAVLTAVIALVPFGAPLVWGSLGVWLLLTGHSAAGLGLLLWGMLVVSWIDKLVRPMVISSASHVPFLLVMFGVLGGVAAFGLIGLFVGPVVLAIVMALWREWLERSTPSARRMAARRDPSHLASHRTTTDTRGSTWSRSPTSWSQRTSPHLPLGRSIVPRGWQ